MRRCRQRRLPMAVGRVVVAASVVISCSTVVLAMSAPAPASASTLVRPAALMSPSPRGATRLGALNSSQPISFEIMLAPSHPRALAATLRELYDPSSPRYEQWLRPGEFQRRFGPTSAAVQAVVDWLDHVGLTSTHLVDGTIQVRTTVRSVSHALAISFSRYRRTNGGEGFSTMEAPLLPRAIVPDITSIVGLSNIARSQSSHEMVSRADAIRPNVRSGAISCSASIEQQANKLGGWSTRQTDTSYQVNKLQAAGLAGSGKTIAVYELAPHAQSDTATYIACFGLHNSVTTTEVDNGPDDTNPSDVVEANLDIEAAAATAPQANIVSYEGPNTERGGIDVWAAIVHDDTAQVVSTSWGLCETLETNSDRTALHTLFMQAAAQGQTIFAASGDSGSEDCVHENGNKALTVDAPANDPFVTGVGGTSLIPQVALTNPDHEPVWNDCLDTSSPSCAAAGGASGGGASQVYPKPTWQPRITSTCRASCREVPDLSANAGIGEAFASSGQWFLISGTSIAVPKLAGMATDIGSGCIKSLGAFNVKLYALATTGVYGIALRDVPTGEGNNDLTRTHTNQYLTATGFDLATGLGSPIASGLACPEVTRVSSTSAAPGAHVTITGLALARATISFGKVPAQVLTHTTTSATVVVPAGAGTVVVSASDQIGQGSLHTSFSYQ